ncbi:MAG: hypothetical protein FWD01_00105 [Defluviitaleaceae bacterium]|nr:hypothetical protein [Defluviitaleaceae bacterium]
MHDLFELAVDLIFDPPETNADRVLIAMRKAEQGFIGLLRSETETIKMNELNAKIAFLQQIRKEIFEDYHNYPNCKRLSRGFRELALKRTEIEIAKLKSAVDTLAAVGKKVITEGSLNRQKQNSGIRLSIENIEKVYQDAGFTIQKTSKAAKPQFPARIEYISENLKRIRGFSQYRQFYPTSPDNADVDDLYAFIAFLENDPKNAARYRAKTTPEIKKILDDQALKIAPREETARDPLGKIIKDTISMSKSNVFNNDANREKYEKYLLYKLPELSLLFQRLKNAPKDSL